jgi:hypothetical protein
MPEYEGVKVRKIEPDPNPYDDTVRCSSKGMRGNRMDRGADRQAHSRRPRPDEDNT